MRKGYFFLSVLLLAGTAATTLAGPGENLRANIALLMERTGLKGDVQKDAEVMTQVFPRLSERLSEAPGYPGLDSATIAQYKIFREQIMPLYEYQLDNRVVPGKIDEDVEVKQIYQTPRDACYYGIGDPRNTYDPKGIDCEECIQSGGKTKASGSYAWGMTALDGKIYWSTNNNYLCMPGYGQVATTGKENGPFENSCWVCEYQKGIQGARKGIYGDIYAPRVFEYDTRSGVVTDITPADTLLEYCQGLRSAAYHKGVMFFGGPSIKGGSSTQSASSVFLAYSPAQKKFIGSSDMASVQGCQITNVRRWIVVDDILYCGVGIRDQQGKDKGAVLRWNGSVDEPFKFEIVGWTASEAAEIEYHKGRLYIGGWPTYQNSSALYRSPLIPQGGFTSADATEWEKIWQFSDYEANPGSKNMSYFSVMKSWKGRLYWGMFSNTFGVVYATQRKFGTLESAEAIANILGTLRSTTLWAADDPGRKRDIQLLYGEEKLPVFNETSNKWELRNNESRYRPRFGRSGYGNIFAAYTWAMSVYDDKLYVGTMDMSNLIDPAMGYTFGDSTINFGGGNGGNGGNGGRPGGGNGNDPFGGLGDLSNFSMVDVLKALLRVDDGKLGYECLQFSDLDQPARMVSDNGFGNPAAYGIRNMQVDDKYLYIGTANPLNLHEKGGWEILRVKVGNPTGGVEEKPLVPARVLVKQQSDMLTFSTLDGSDITSVSIADASGARLYYGEPRSNSTDVDLFDMHGKVIIATIVAGGQTTTAKICVK